MVVMAKYIDAEKLYTKVDALMVHYAEVEEEMKDDVGLSIYYQGKRKMCSEIIDIITSLQQEQPEVDLEKEWEEFEDWMESYNQSDYPTCYEPKQIARHFYELGLKAKEESK